MGQLIVLRPLKTTTGEQKHVAILENGHVNLTHICNAAGKDYSRWSRLDSSKDEIQRLEKRRVIDIDSQKMAIPYVVKLDHGPQKYRGTYGPIRLAISVALWADETFHDQVLDWLEDIQQGVQVSQETIREALFSVLLLEQPDSWEARFKPSFWKPLARIDGGKIWRTPKDHKASWAQFIGTYIYDEMFRDHDAHTYVHTEEALRELRARNPYRPGSWDRMRRNHQHLTPLGLDRLAQQVKGITKQLLTFEATCKTFGHIPTLGGFKAMFLALQRDQPADIVFCDPLDIPVQNEAGQLVLFSVA